MFRKAALAALLIITVAPAFADDVKIGDITIQNAWARATPKGAEVGGGYLTIRNNGAAPEKLTGGSADFATVEVHEMSMAGGVMKMREVAGGLTIPAHGSVTLAPNGYHLMFLHLKQPFVKGQPVKATLTFEPAGSAEVSFDVRGLGAGAGAPAKSDNMGGMKM
jgi:copper(I)-binding protein